MTQAIPTRAIVRPKRKIAVSGASHRLGSFGAFCIFSQTVSADLDSSRFGPFLKRATAIPHGHRLGSFGRISFVAGVSAAADTKNGTADPCLENPFLVSRFIGVHLQINLSRVQLPCQLSQDRFGRALDLFVPHSEHRSIIVLHRRWVAQIAGGSLAMQDDRVGPGLALVFTEPRLNAQGFTPMAVTHEQSPVLKPKQMRGQSPHTDGGRLRPGLSRIFGFSLERFACVGFIVIANLYDQPTVGSLDGMQLMVVAMIVAIAGRDRCKPLP